MLRKAKARIITTIFLMLALGGVVLAVDNYPYFDPKDTGYGITNDDKPWFDGKDYPYFRDMYDGKNLKPMEEGSYEKFPQDSVPVKISLNKIQRIYDPFIPAIAGDGAGKAGHPREYFPKKIQDNLQQYLLLEDKSSTTPTARHVMVQTDWPRPL